MSKQLKLTKQNVVYLTLSNLSKVLQKIPMNFVLRFLQIVLNGFKFEKIKTF